MNKIVIEPELLESMYHGNRYSIQGIADIFGCGHSTIWRMMIEYGIPSRSSGYMVTDFTFNTIQKEIFEGCMLGDGGLVWQSNNCYFSNGDKHNDYLIWLQKQLGVEDISRIIPVYHFKGAGAPFEHLLTTRVIPSIREEHKRWYPYETRHGTHENMQTKIIPKDIELTPIKMLFWYIGDGTYVYDGAAMFCNLLVYNDWLTLSKKVCKLLDVDNGVYINKHRKDDVGIQRYYLRLNRVVTNKFFELVDTLGFDIPECYLYKFGR